MQDSTAAEVQEDAEVAVAVPAPTRSKKAHIWAAALIVFALLSIFVFARLASSPAVVNPVRDSLDSQQATVAAMAAGATALSAGLSAIPTDAMEPIANQLIELTGWFTVIIGAIILQKMLFTAAGSIAFTVIIPLACILGVAFVYTRRTTFRSIALKFATFGAVLFLAVPGSIAASGLITATYTDIAASANVAEEAAEEAAQAEEDSADAGAGLDEGSETGDGGLLGRIQDWMSDAVDSVGNWVEGAVNNVSEFSDDAVDALNSYMEKIALLIITTCVMPILVFLLFGWVIKQLFAIDIGVGKVGRTVQSHSSRAVTMTGQGVSKAMARKGVDQT